MYNFSFLNNINKMFDLTLKTNKLNLSHISNSKMYVAAKK